MYDEGFGFTVQAVRIRFNPLIDFFEQIVATMYVANSVECLHILL